MYGVADRIEFILANYCDFARCCTSQQRRRQEQRTKSNTSHSALSADGSPPSVTASMRDSVNPIDVVFLSPPWGGPTYIYGSPKKPSNNNADDSIFNDRDEISAGSPGDYSLASVLPLPGSELYGLTREITPNVAFFLPKNTNLTEISSLASGQSKGSRSKGAAGKEPEAMIEVEEQYMGGKLKGLVCYFGELAVQ